MEASGRTLMLKIKQRELTLCECTHVPRHAQQRSRVATSLFLIGLGKRYLITSGLLFRLDWLASRLQAFFCPRSNTDYRPCCCTVLFN